MILSCNDFFHNQPFEKENTFAAGKPLVEKFEFQTGRYY